MAAGEFTFAAVTNKEEEALQKLFGQQMVPLMPAHDKPPQPAGPVALKAGELRDRLSELLEDEAIDYDSPVTVMSSRQGAVPADMVMSGRGPGYETIVLIMAGVGP